MIILVYLVMLVTVEWVFHIPKNEQMYPLLKSPVFMMRELWMEDWATYCVLFGLAVPVGVILWRFCAQGWRWFAMMLGVLLVWEIAQPFLSVDYFRLYDLVAVGLGLLTGKLWNAILNISTEYKWVLYVLLLVGVVVALAAENMTYYSYSAYEAMTHRYIERQKIVQAILWYGVLAGKAVCLSSVASAISDKRWTIWLCALLLCMTMPRDVWLPAMSAPWHLLSYMLCAAVFAILGNVLLFGRAGQSQVKRSA